VLVALLLSGLYPEHREAFMALAKEVGQHRMVGGYHFPSDVAYGEQIGRVLYESMARASVRTAAAKYKDKKQVPKADGSGKTTVYVYSERQVANRHREKAERLEDFKPALAELRAQVKKDLDSDDPKKNLVALAVGLIDATYERVGNDESADNGHYGVTGWLRKHVTFKGKRAVIRYTGKSGVKHEKSVDDEALVGALKKCCGDKDGEEQVLSLGKHAVTSGDVNKYLKPYGITAKDLRGLHANREMQERLRAIRSKGPKLPRLRKERDPILKEEFKQALEGAAEAVGHEPSTLRKQYLVPGIEDAYMKDGTVPRDLTASTRRVAAHYRRVSTRSLRLDPTVRAFFKQFASVFEAYPNLWVKGGGARDALMNFYADHAAGYQRATRSMRDIDLVLIGGTIAEKVALLSQFEGTVKPEDLDIRAASLGQYFKTRDVGINEVALRPDFMLFTDKAVNDIHRGVVNPSGGSFDPEWQNLSPRVGLRSVLFALREGLNPFDNQLVGEAVLSARPFDLLLHLYKAFDTGVPDEFYAAVQANPYLRGTHSAEEALLSLSEKVYDFTRTPAQQRTYDDARSLVLGDRWEGQGWRVAAKSDAEREDEEAERLVKPEPKYKPPRGDLRRRRVDTERDDDPDKKQDDKDRSQNYKDASVRAVVQRVAAAWLFKVGQGNPLMERAKKEFEAYEKKHPDTELDVNTFLERLAQRSKTTSEGSNTDAETKADAAHYAQQERKVKTERVQKLVDKVSAEWAELENSLPLTSENRKRISSSIDSYTPKQREEFAKAFASAREAHVRKYSDEGYDPDAVSTALLDMDAKFTKADPKRVAEHAVEVIFTDRVLLNPMLLTPDDPLSDDEGKGTADPKKSAARVSQSIQRFSRASKRERAEMSKRLDAAIREAPEGTAKQEELLAVRFGLTAAEALHPIKEDGDDEGKADQDPKPPKGMSKVEFGLLQHLADDSEKSSELLGLSFRASRKDKSAQEDTRKFVREATRSMKPEQINNLLPEEMQSASLAVRSLLKEMASDRASFRKSKGKSTAKEDAAISEYEAEMDALGDMLGERLSDLVADSVGRKVQPEDDDVGSVYKNMVKNRPKLNGGKPPSKKDFGAFLDDLMKSFRKLLGNKGVTAHLHLAEPPRVSVGGLYHL
jgi:DNA topoisomerase IB